MDLYNIDNADWHYLIDAVSSLTDHHDFFHKLSEGLAVDKNSAGKTICAFVVKNNESDFDPLRKAIDKFLVLPEKAAA